MKVDLAKKKKNQEKWWRNAFLVSVLKGSIYIETFC